MGCATSEPRADELDLADTGTDELGESEQELFRPRTAEIVTDQPTTTNTPVGLAIEVENGVGAPLRVRADRSGSTRSIRAL